MVAGQRPFHLQLDRAKPHYEKETAKWLVQHMKGWIKPWMSKGGGLNPLDHGIWPQIEARAWDDKPQTLIDLRTSILKHISEFAQDAIEKCIPSFPKRMAMCTQEEGGTFEHKFKRKA